MGKSGGKGRPAKAKSRSQPQGVVARHRGLEVLAKPNSIQAFRAGRLRLEDTVVAFEVFRSVHKSVKAGPGDLRGRTVGEAIEEILSHGEYQMTKRERQELQEQRRCQIVSHFHTQYMDPRTKTPLPVTRIELAMEEARVKVNYQIGLDRQLKEAKAALLGKLPMAPRT